MDACQVIWTEDTERDIDRAYDVEINFFAQGQYHLIWFYVTTYRRFNNSIIVILSNPSQYSYDYQESWFDISLREIYHMASK